MRIVFCCNLFVFQFDAKFQCFTWLNDNIRSLVCKEENFTLFEMVKALNFNSFSLCNGVGCISYGNVRKLHFLRM